MGRPQKKGLCAEREMEVEKKPRTSALGPATKIISRGQGAARFKTVIAPREQVLREKSLRLGPKITRGEPLGHR